MAVTAIIIVTAVVVKIAAILAQTPSIAAIILTAGAASM